MQVVDRIIPHLADSICNADLHVDGNDNGQNAQDQPGNGLAATGTPSGTDYAKHKGENPEDKSAIIDDRDKGQTDPDNSENQGGRREAAFLMGRSDGCRRGRIRRSGCRGNGNGCGKIVLFMLMFSHFKTLFLHKYPISGYLYYTNMG